MRFIFLYEFKMRFILLYEFMIWVLLGGFVGQWRWDAKNVKSNFIMILIYIKEITKYIIFYVNIYFFGRLMGGWVGKRKTLKSIFIIILIN